MSNKPKISIITPSYDSGRFIEEAIESVQTQSYGNVEHIVVDGGSTDNTIEIVNKFTEVDLISEDDEGIYDALNKGIEKASGEYIGWLNADDVYTEDAFELYLEAYDQNCKPEIIVGDSDVFHNSDNSMESLQKYEFTSPQKLSEGKLNQSAIGLNGCLISSELIGSIGKFDPTLEIAGDTEYLYRIVSNEPDAVAVNKVVYRYRSHEDSLTFQSFNNSGAVRIQSDAKLIGTKEYLDFLPRYFHNDSVPNPLRKYSKEQYRERLALLFEYNLRVGDVNQVVSLLYYIGKNDVMWYYWALKKLMVKINTWN